MTKGTTLKILKALENRRRRRSEIKKSMVSHMQYQAGLRRQFDWEIMQAEQTRIKWRSTSAWHRAVMRNEYVELSKALAEKIEKEESTI